MRRPGIARPLVYSVIFIVVTVAATAILAVSIANTGVGATTTYHAVFTDVTGLSVGDDVDIAGVRIGDITSIAVTHRNLADVAFEVPSDRQLPSSVTATLYYKNLVGQLYMGLAQGTGPVGRLLRPGGTIPVAQTTSALDLTELFNGFQPLFEALSPGEVNALSTDIIELLQGEGPTLDSLISNIGTLATTVAHKSAVIDAVIKNLNSVVSTVNSRGSELATLVTSLQQLVSGLAADRKPFGDAITAMASLTHATAGMLKGFNPPLQADIADLARLSANLAAGTPAIDSFLKTWPTKEADIGRLASYGSWFNLFECQATVTGVQEAYGPAPTGVPISAADKARCTS
ncbi:MAG: MCE family protein [Actinobacteria bacterium]|nr:MCE family protein [Actinomycetota bacterium]MBO0830651.1 MCE family protein [Actinomycetota bacterium]MBO0833980.1 MCE family protein [Actinomycetota bacterium]